ncbi:hypothetical protein SH1V18_47620 [Vallitalea longa]|uniref:Uncharacterized protein n=1 Tax=Vallitalea longa TaxID=2936439 RepID=A0A9W6DI57_9FIRM|nr:hypothetical protein [Vallitalea longa]GKX32282.1 hypothetical protein SH1V18_47620 [Vallitalea longa]
MIIGNFVEFGGCNMWRDDDDRLDNILNFIVHKRISQYPLICPICSTQELNFYMHRYKEHVHKGAIWIWCSNCKYFSHFSLVVPDWWENSNWIALEDLTALPINLESKREQISKHIKNTIGNN